MLDLSNEFLDKSRCDQPIPSAIQTEISRTYQMHIGNMHFGYMNGRHTFLRISEGSRVVCDFHGVGYTQVKQRELFVAIEPGQYDYFKHLKPDGFVQVWEGNAEELGERLRRLVLAADKINESPPDYKLLSVNCNTVLRTFLELADIDVPKLRGWAPGIGRIFDDVVNYVRSYTDKREICEVSYVENFESLMVDASRSYEEHNLVKPIEGFVHDIK